MVRKSYRILLVEDDQAVGESLKAGLEREGFNVQWQTAGEDAIESAKGHPPDLILLDVRLPDISGFDVCRRLRQLKFNQPILMLTVQGAEMDKVLGLEMGADDYITKPYSLRELLSRIRAQLRRAYGEFSRMDSDQMVVGDLTIDRSRAQVFREEEQIHLSPTEFRLLVYLAQHPGQAMSRAQILDSVWGYDAEVESESTVNVCVRRLREKVERDPSHPSLILTVPGIGYRLVD